MTKIPPIGEELANRTAQAREREATKFAPLNSILDQLEPAASEKVALDPQAIALSTAISLRRIAEALQPVNEKAEVPISLALEPGVDIESVAGDALNITEIEVKYMPTEEVTILIRRLASAVLRKAEK